MALTYVSPFIGIAENFAILYDYDASRNLIYTGWSQPGLGTTERGWRIMHQTYNSNNDVTAVVWPNNSTAFDFVWADRASYDYGISNPSYTAIILTSPDATRWALTVLTDGTLVTTATPSGPSDAYTTSPVVLQDTGGGQWTITIDNTGGLITTFTGIGGLNLITLEDSSGGEWELTVNTGGSLITTGA